MGSSLNRSTFKHAPPGRSWTKEEREWASLDKILNPEPWHGLKLRIMKDQSQETADQLQSYLKPADCIKETIDPEDVPPPSVAKKKSMFGRMGNLFGQVVSSCVNYYCGRCCSLSYGGRSRLVMSLVKTADHGGLALGRRAAGRVGRGPLQGPCVTEEIQRRLRRVLRHSEGSSCSSGLGRPPSGSRIASLVILKKFQ